MIVEIGEDKKGKWIIKNVENNELRGEELQDG